MTPPEALNTELERILALENLQILDTLPEPEYDRITQLAASICEVPIACISFLGAERVWFKSHYGLTQTQLPRDTSYCTHTINEKSRFIQVADVRLDDRFLDCPLMVEEHQLLFYAGAVILDENQLPIGVLSVFGHDPKTLTQAQKKSLKLLSAQVSDILRVRKRSLCNVDLISENRRTALIQRAGDMIFEINEQGRFSYANSRLLNITGFTEQEIYSKHFWEIVVSEHQGLIKKHYQGIIKSKTRSDYYEFKSMTKTGSMWVGQNVEIDYIGDRVKQAWVVARDITELYEAREKLRQSERKYRLISENSRDFISLIDTDANYIYVSSSVKELLGYDIEDLLGVNAFDITHPEDAARLASNKKIEDGKNQDVRFAISRIRKKNGAYLWMESIIKAVRDSNGEVTNFQISARDISDRKKKDDQIETRQAKLESLIQNAKHAASIFDAEGNHVSFNQVYEHEMEKFSGYKPKMGSPLNFAKLNNTYTGFEKAVKLAHKKKVSKTFSFDHEGKSYHLVGEFSPISDKKDNVIGLTVEIRDFTDKVNEQKKSELYKEGLQKLNDIITDSTLDMKSQIQMALDVLLDYLGLDIGIISTIDKDDYMVYDTIVRLPDIKIKVGDHYPLKETYCHTVFRRTGALTIDLTNESEFHNHPCYRVTALKSYIGATYYVNGKKRGTVNFSSPDSRQEAFSHQEIEFVNMFSRWIGFLIERDEFREQLLSERTVLKAFVFSAPAAIAMLNEKLEYIAVSAKWLDAYQLGDSSVLGESFGELSPALYKFWKSKLAKSLRGKVYKSDGEKITLEGQEEQWLKWEIRPWMKSKGEVGGIIMFTEDITDQKTQAEEIRQAKELAEEAAKAKELFFATMSHEIRTPMNAITGVADLLLQSNPRKSQLDDLNLLKFSSDNLLSLINDVLDFSKIEAGKIALESIDFNLKDLLFDVKKSLHYRAKEKGLDLVLKYDENLPEIFEGDAMRVSQVILNLVSNAIKFTYSGYVKVESRLLWAKQNRCFLRISVEDTGIGIDEDKIGGIFKDFEQGGEDVSRKFGGTGLGLAISERIIALMGSEIQVESVIGQGSVFSFDLELISRQKNRNELRGTKPKTLKNLTDNHIRILAAEDNPGNRMILKRILDLWGVDVEFAFDGQIAIEKIKKRSYDMVIMDIQMPEVDGYMATERIRKMDDPYFQNIPIVALSAFTSSEGFSKATASGMNDYLIKPIRMPDLHACILKYSKKTLNAKRVVVEEGPPSELRRMYPYLYQITDGNESEVIDLLRTISKTVPHELQKLSTHYEHGQFDLLAETLHKIKPNLESLELVKLGRQTDILEEAALIKNKSVLSDHLSDFIESVKEKLVELENS